MSSVTLVFIFNVICVSTAQDHTEVCGVDRFVFFSKARTLLFKKKSFIWINKIAELDSKYHGADFTEKTGFKKCLNSFLMQRAWVPHLQTSRASYKHYILAATELNKWVRDGFF